MMKFKGWPATALEFYEGLEADNSKAYWTDHKAIYDDDVYGPMTALLGELADEFGPGRIFRPNRDIRFSLDKSPYKTALGARVGEAGYVQISADGLMAGSGMYHMMPDQLQRYRGAVDSDAAGERLEDVIAKLTTAKVHVHGTDPLKTAPKGYAKDHPRVVLLRNKGLIAMRDWPAAAWMGTAAAKTRIVDLLRAAKPLKAWLDDHVGPTTMEGGRPALTPRAPTHPADTLYGHGGPVRRPGRGGQMAGRAGPTRAPTRSTTTTPARPTTSSACTPTRAARPTRATSATTPSATCWSASGPCRATPC